MPKMFAGNDDTKTNLLQKLIAGASAISSQSRQLPQGGRQFPIIPILTQGYLNNAQIEQQQAENTRQNQYMDIAIERNQRENLGQYLSLAQKQFGEGTTFQLDTQNKADSVFSGDGFLITPMGTFRPNYGAMQEKERLKSLAETNAKRDLFNNEFENFKSVNDFVTRSETGGFIDRTRIGMASLISSAQQKDIRGIATSQYNSAKKRLGVAIARQTDVGNLSFTERKAGEQLVPSLFDAKKVAETKITYIQELNKVMNFDEPKEMKGLRVRQILNKFRNESFYEGPKNDEIFEQRKVEAKSKGAIGYNPNIDAFVDRNGKAVS